MAMRLIFVGPQGSGKGTQAEIISDKLKIAHISTGDLLRHANGKLKKEIDECINAGNLVSDELILKILKKRISLKDCKKGFILDGFPRNLSQAEALSKITKIDKVVDISITDKESIRRISGRRGCGNCGEIYNIATSPKPKKKNICDNCGKKLSKRKDDNKSALKKRLKIYHKDTEKILKYYKFAKINGKQPIESVTEEILTILRGRKICQ